MYIYLFEFIVRCPLCQTDNDNSVIHPVGGNVPDGCIDDRCFRSLKLTADTQVIKSVTHRRQCDRPLVRV